VPADRAADPADPADPVDTLAAALVRACRALAAAGRTDDAARIAADGWLALRTTRPALALKLDGAMHYIARLEQRGERAAARAGAHHDPGSPLPQEESA